MSEPIPASVSRALNKTRVLVGLRETREKG